LAEINNESLIVIPEAHEKHQLTEEVETLSLISEQTSKAQRETSPLQARVSRFLGYVQSTIALLS
jgi:hypothetical protein